MHFNGKCREGAKTPEVILQYILYLNLEKNTFGSCTFLTLSPVAMERVQKVKYH